MGNAWILASAPAEGAAVDKYWNGKEWQSILNDAYLYFDAAGMTLDQMSSVKDDFQRRYTHCTVRLLRVSITITPVELNQTSN